jgi:hypothetical protein
VKLALQTRNDKLKRMASNSFAVNALFKRRPNPQRAEPTQLSELKKKYGEITLLDFPQFTKDTYPGVPTMDLWSSLFGDFTDDTMYMRVERNGQARPGELDPSTASAKTYLDKLVANMVSTGIKSDTYLQQCAKEPCRS